MIALIRKADNRVMNERQGQDWGDVKVAPGLTKKGKLDKLLNDLEQTTDKEPQKKKELEQAIEKMKQEHETWLYNFRARYAKYHNTVAEDYFTVQVPPEISKQEFFSSRYIEYDGENLTFDNRPAYTIDGSTITCTGGWVRDNDRLLEDDITDFSEEKLQEPLYFQLWYAQDEQTREISVQLLVRHEDEDFSPFPKNLTQRGKVPICEGKVEIDNTITLRGK